MSEASIVFTDLPDGKVQITIRFEDMEAPGFFKSHSLAVILFSQLGNMQGCEVEGCPDGIKEFNEISEKIIEYRKKNGL